MNHFNNKLTSPIISVFIGYLYIFILGIIFYFCGLYKNSKFFSFGTPVNFMGTEINDDRVYYILILLFFFHQLINNFVNDVTYPWIINCVQDPKSKNLVYSKCVSLTVINMFSLYSELDVMFIVAGVLSQFPFFISLIIANVISVSFINWQYIKQKDNFYNDEYFDIV